MPKIFLANPSGSETYPKCPPGVTYRYTLTSEARMAIILQLEMLHVSPISMTNLSLKPTSSGMLSSMAVYATTSCPKNTSALAGPTKVRYAARVSTSTEPASPGPRAEALVGQNRPLDREEGDDHGQNVTEGWPDPSLTGTRCVLVTTMSDQPSEPSGRSASHPPPQIPRRCEHSAHRTIACCGAVADS